MIPQPSTNRENTLLDNYTFNEHRHYYAVWTSARAVSRNFTSTLMVKNAIEASDLREFAESDAAPTKEQFDEFHRENARKIISSLQGNGITNVSYGRAAKIIAIYLKTAVVLCSQAQCKKSEVIHPPIDAILLSRMADQLLMPKLKLKRWTQFEEDEYWDLVTSLQNEVGAFNWRVEYFWRPERD